MMTLFEFGGGGRAIGNRLERIWLTWTRASLRSRRIASSSRVKTLLVNAEKVIRLRVRILNYL